MFPKSLRRVLGGYGKYAVNLVKIGNTLGRYIVVNIHGECYRDSLITFVVKVTFTLNVMKIGFLKFVIPLILNQHFSIYLVPGPIKCSSTAELHKYISVTLAPFSALG